MNTRTTLWVLRFRFRISTRSRIQVAEESLVLASRGSDGQMQWLRSEGVAALLEAKPSGNVDPGKARQFLSAAVGALDSVATYLDEVHAERAVNLTNDHRRVRESAKARVDGLQVEPIPPPDVLGIYVYLPV